MALEKLLHCIFRRFTEQCTSASFPDYLSQILEVTMNNKCISVISELISNLRKKFSPDKYSFVYQAYIQKPLNSQ